MAKQVLYLAKSVSASTEDCDTYTVPNGKDVTVIDFHGEAAFSASSAVKIIWDSGGADTILWAMKGSGEMPKKAAEDFPTMTGNGTKKIALCLDNGEGSSIFMSGHVILEVED